MKIFDIFFLWVIYPIIEYKNSLLKKLFNVDIDYNNAFLKNLSHVGFANIIAMSLLFFLNIFAAKFFGPEGYGAFTLVQSVAMILHIPMILGMGTSIVKYCSEREDVASQSSIITSTYILVGTYTLISILTYYCFSDYLSSLFSIDLDNFYYSVIFAFLLLIYTLSTNTLKGLFLLKKFAIVEVVRTVIILLSFIILISINYTSYKSMLYSMFIAYGLLGLGILLTITRKYFSAKLDINWTKEIWIYGLISAVGGFSSVIYTNLDKILINKYMSLQYVGIYNVYYFSSINILLLFSGIFVTVFFPTISRHKDKRSILLRMNKKIPVLSGLIFPFVILMQVILLILYGKDYPLDIVLIVLFAFSSVLIGVNNIYVWFFASEGIKGIKFTVISTFVIGITNIILNVCLIPIIGLYGAIISTIISFSIGIIILCRGNRLFNDDGPSKR